VSTVVVAGALANKPWNGGEAWVRLSYVLGLERLGCRTFFLEQVADHACTPEAVAFFAEVMREFGLQDRCALVRDDGRVVHGVAAGELLDVAAGADLLVSVSGNLTCEPLFSRFERRAYVDVDPGYTQLWLEQGHSVGRARDHHAWFTVGLNVGTDGCSLPDAGLAWRPMLPPVALDEWQRTPSPGPERLTTVAAWRGGYGRLEHEGTLYTQKAHEFRKLAGLPGRLAGTFEIALHIDEADAADRRSMEEQGWRLVDPAAVVATPAAFRHYVEGSGGELSPAQGLYVETGSGWFSDRTARYLAAGRPAVVQDTRIDAELLPEAGLLTFRTPDDAVAAIERMRSDYDAQCAAARAFAEEHLDSDRVLARMLEEAGA
jgi:hypothetical protein